MHITMRKKEIPHEYRVRDGVHSWVYWRAALPVVLDFVSMGISSVLRQNAKGNYDIPLVGVIQAKPGSGVDQQ
jgi:hypothetical protein